MSFAVLGPHTSSLAIVGIGIGPNTSRLIDELGPNGLSWSIPVYMHESALPPHPALCVCPCKLLAENLWKSRLSLTKFSHPHRPKPERPVILTVEGVGTSGSTAVYLGNLHMSSEIDSVSDSSTLVYDHEPFETFQVRALKLCETALGAASGKTSIERMQGGGFNRIIGVSIITSDAGERPALEQYILRIPRLEVSQLGRDLAPLQLLRQRSQIPIPEVIAFDTTTQNVLESPYMIQKRIPGVPLFPTYPNMPQQMKRVIAEELGEAYSELHSVRSVTAGRLTLSPSRDSLLVQPFDDIRTDAIVPYEDGPAAEATIDMLSSILTHKKELAGAEGPNRSWMIEFLDHFKTAASEMSALGVLDRSDYCLCHLDLEPRNILAQAPSSTQPQTVIGILDWDSAIFAPALLSCSPPMWLWAWNEEADEDERLAGDIPSTPELRELKELFEEAAGPTYRRFAYGAQYRLARQLFRFTIDGLHTNEDLMATELLLKEWGDVQKSLKLANDTTAEPQIACSVTNQ